MNDQIRGRLFGAGAIALGAALLLPSLFGGRLDEWGSWIYDYQNLITGFLALGAAYFTIQQMRRSDERTERRHRELAELQLRPYSLKVERLCEPNIDDLEYCLADICRMEKLAIPKVGDTPEAIEHYKKWLSCALGIASDLQGLLQRTCWEEDADVLDGWTSKLYTEMRESCSSLIEAAQRQQKLFNQIMVSEESPVSQKVASLFQEDTSHLRKIDELAELIEWMIENLRALSTRFSYAAMSR